MRTIRRMLYSEVLRAVGFVALAFLLLFMFFDLMNQVRRVHDYGAQGYTLWWALTYVLLRVPSRLYNLLPIAVLIGTIYVLARLAESSQYTILRTSGFGPAQALLTVLGLGLAFAGFTFALGDYVAPAGNRVASMLQARFMGDLTVGRTGAWIKDLQEGHSYSINVGALKAGGTMNGVRIFAFERDSGHLTSTLDAARGEFGSEGWVLHDVRQREFRHTDTGQPWVQTSHQDTLQWATSINNDMVAAALLSPDRMQAVELFQYIRHLHANGQNAQQYELEFWRKVFYPLGCLVMIVMALPFAYLHFRSRNIAGQVFIGVLVGISFFLLNNVFGFIGSLRNWTPWLAAAAPAAVYSVLSLSAFGWLVLRQ